MKKTDIAASNWVHGEFVDVRTETRLLQIRRRLRISTLTQNRKVATLSLVLTPKGPNALDLGCISRVALCNRWIVATVAMIAGLFSTVSIAQVTDVNTSVFAPATGRHRVFSVEQVGVSPAWVPYAHIGFHGERDSLVLTVGPREEVLVAQHWFADFNVGVGLFGHLQLDISVPVALSMSSGDAVNLIPSVSGGGLGDITVRVRGVALANTDGGFGVALSAHFLLPTGDGERFRGERSGAFQGSLLLEYQFPVAVLTLNTGVRARFQESQVASELFGNELTYGLGLDIEVGTSLGIGVELFGRTPLNNPFAEENRSGLEALLGPRWFLWSGLSLEFAVGAGLVRGLSTPDFRFWSGISWAPTQDDMDSL
ncbi:MAG: transporter [Myxococcota bacterium]|nr:transporter [Myxococcota bacterium]